MKRGEQKMLLCNCICAWQPVRVVHGDGQVRRLSPPVTVEELLKCHPHHFVCEPTSSGPLFHSGMLPLDMELEEGRIYLLLPLPRLLPHLASTPSCPCFSQCHRLDSTPSYSYYYTDAAAAAPPFEATTTTADVEQYQASPLDGGALSQQPGQFLVVAKPMRTLRHRVVKSKLVRSVARVSRRMLPERMLLRLSLRRAETHLAASSVLGKSVQFSCSRNRWRPGLECISEVDLLTGLLNHRDFEGNDLR